MAYPPDQSEATPRATPSMASVMMKDWMLKRVVTSPLTMPTNPPRPSTSSTVGTVPRP